MSADNGFSENDPELIQNQPVDVITILEAVRTELDCERLDGATIAIYDYWHNRGHNNGTEETDRQINELSREVAHLRGDPVETLLITGFHLAREADNKAS